jgi:pimeloyl-ACP methyl ester carboxylesterase
MLLLPERERIRLADGRYLSFQEIGVSGGAAVIYFHGSPSSGSEWRLFGTSGDIAESGLRIIAVDRPGSAGSSFQANRCILDWTADVTEIASHLRLDSFAVLGYSGGGPYALACALELSQRLTAVVTVSGTAPFDVPGVTDGINSNSWRFMQLAHTRPMVSRAISWIMGLTGRIAPGAMAAMAIRSLPEPDAAALRDPQLAAAFARLVSETTPRGAQQDTELMVSQWGFHPAAITIPVTMWHGTEDCNAPPAMARWLAERMPNSDLRWLESEGHVSAAANHGPTILNDLAQRASR